MSCWRDDTSQWVAFARILTVGALSAWARRKLYSASAGLLVVLQVTWRQVGRGGEDVAGMVLGVWGGEASEGA